MTLNALNIFLLCQTKNLCTVHIKAYFLNLATGLLVDRHVGRFRGAVFIYFHLKFSKAHVCEICVWNMRLYPVWCKIKGQLHPRAHTEKKKTLNTLTLAWKVFALCYIYLFLRIKSSNSTSSTSAGLLFGYSNQRPSRGWNAFSVMALQLLISAVWSTHRKEKKYVIYPWCPW